MSELPEHRALVPETLRIRADHRFGSTVYSGTVSRGPASPSSIERVLGSKLTEVYDECRRRAAAANLVVQSEWVYTPRNGRNLVMTDFGLLAKRPAMPNPSDATVNVSANTPVVLPNDQGNSLQVGSAYVVDGVRVGIVTERAPGGNTVQVQLFPIAANAPINVPEPAAQNEPVLQSSPGQWVMVPTNNGRRYVSLRGDNRFPNLQGTGDSAVLAWQDALELTRRYLNSPMHRYDPAEIRSLGHYERLALIEIDKLLHLPEPAAAPASPLRPPGRWRTLRENTGGQRVQLEGDDDFEDLFGHGWNLADAWRDVQVRLDVMLPSMITHHQQAKFQVYKQQVADEIMGVEFTALHLPPVGQIQCNVNGGGFVAAVINDTQCTAVTFGATAIGALRNLRAALRQGLDRIGNDAQAMLTAEIFTNYIVRVTALIRERERRGEDRLPNPTYTPRPDMSIEQEIEMRNRRLASGESMPPGAVADYSQPANYAGPNPYKAQLEYNRFAASDESPWTMRINGEPFVFSGNTHMEARDGLFAQLQTAENNRSHGVTGRRLQNQLRLRDLTRYVNMVRRFNFTEALTAIQSQRGDPKPEWCDVDAENRGATPTEIPSVTLWQNDDGDTWNISVEGLDYNASGEGPRNARNILLDQLNTVLSVESDGTRRQLLRNMITAVTEYNVPGNHDVDDNHSRSYVAGNRVSETTGVRLNFENYSDSIHPTPESLARLQSLARAGVDPQVPAPRPEPTQDLLNDPPKPLRAKRSIRT